MTEPGFVTTSDGVAIEIERRAAEGTCIGTVVLCHPHPQHGGDMHSVVVSPLFNELPTHGIATVRFNFRGVGRSGGAWDNGNAEALDVLAVTESIASEAHPGPLVVAGFSFGADMALNSAAPDADGYCLIAAPFHFGRPDAFAASPRPKLFILAERDEFRDAAWVVDHVSDWPNTQTSIVAGANHFFVARTDPVVALVRQFVERLTHA